MLVDVQGQPLRRAMPPVIGGACALELLERLECSRRMGGSASRRNRAAASGSKFSPRSISGLTLWLRADLGVTNVAGKCSQWLDQSATGAVFTQGTASAQPVINATGIGGKQTLDGASVNSTYLGSTTPLSTVLTASAWTAIVVAKYTGAVATNANSFVLPGVISDLSGFWSVFNCTTTAGAVNWDGADKSARPTLASNTAYYGVYQLNAGNITGAVNGGGTSSTPCGNLTTLTGTLGTHKAGATPFFDGPVGEIILVNRALTAGEIASAVAYIKAFWGL